MLTSQLFQLIIVSRCGVKEVPTIAYSLHSYSTGSTFLQITYYLMVDCLIPVSYMFIYKSRLSRSQKATFNTINNQQGKQDFLNNFIERKKIEKQKMNSKNTMVKKSAGKYGNELFIQEVQNEWQEISKEMKPTIKIDN